MAFDGLLVKNLINELKILETGRISKIKQLSKLEIILTIRANKVNHNLIISANSQSARMHLTKNQYETLKEPPSFCMMLRKHLDGGYINTITQIENDRIIKIEVTKINELGDKVIKEMYFEAMGKHSNLIVVEDGKIIESIKHIPPFQNSYRTILPGAMYKLPPMNKPNPFDDFKSNTFEEIMSYQGISPLMANEILATNDAELIHAEPNPVIIKGKKEKYYFIPLSTLEGTQTEYDSISDMLDSYYFNRDTFEKIKQRAKDLTLFIKNEYDKNKNKLDKLIDELSKAEDNDIHRVKGEVLLANLHNLTKGKNKVELLNFYTNENIEISLNPLLSPSENANKYFTKYQKAKKAINHLKEQINLTKNEIEYFDLLTEQIQTASINDVEEIRIELEDNNYLKKKKRKKKAKPNFLTYISDDGTEILVGKNNMQNEYLTHKHAQKYDIWMHAKDIPGSHVIIKDSEPSENAIRTAANLAAYYSKAKNSSSVPVDYTFIRYIKKIPGKKLSFVTYTNQSTIFIDPDHEMIMKLKQK